MTMWHARERRAARAVGVAPAVPDDGGHLLAVVVAERGGIETKERAVEAHRQGYSARMAVIGSTRSARSVGSSVPASAISSVRPVTAAKVAQSPG